MTDNASTRNRGHFGNMTFHCKASEVDASSSALSAVFARHSSVPSGEEPSRSGRSRCVVFVAGRCGRGVEVALRFTLSSTVIALSGHNPLARHPLLIADVQKRFLLLGYSRRGRVASTCKACGSSCQRLYFGCREILLIHAKRSARSGQPGEREVSGNLRDVEGGGASTNGFVYILLSQRHLRLDLLNNRATRVWRVYFGPLRNKTREEREVKVQSGSLPAAVRFPLHYVMASSKRCS